MAQPEGEVLVTRGCEGVAGGAGDALALLEVSVADEGLWGGVDGWVTPFVSMLGQCLDDVLGDDRDVWLHSCISLPWRVVDEP